MGTTNKQKAIIYFVVSLSELTNTHTDDIVDLLTGVCWDEEEAGHFKENIDKI